MNLSYGPEAEAMRVEVQRFLEKTWNRGRTGAEDVRSFRRAAIDAGYLYRSVPREYGGSEQPLDVIKAQIIREEFRAVKAPMEVPGNGTTMVIPTLLKHGTECQKQQFIRPTIEGDYAWAQGYSEPNAGSDLAAVATRGELHGGEWVINGQKIWTSRADRCEFMFALVRTEPALRKHAGLSYLLINLRQPGVTIRPLRQMTGRSEFCEVFFDEARTPGDWIVGKRGEGWAISKTTLKHERATIGGSERMEETFRKLLDLARSSQRANKAAIENADVRQRLAELECWVLAQKYSAYRRFSLAAASTDAGLIGLVNKQLTTEIAQRIAAIAQELLGDEALIQPTLPSEGNARGNSKWLDQIMGSLGVAIAGGASNIQRNIVAERGLDLPRDRQVDA